MSMQPVFDVVAVVIVWSPISCCTGQELYMAKSVDWHKLA